MGVFDVIDRILGLAPKIVDLVKSATAKRKGPPYSRPHVWMAPAYQQCFYCSGFRQHVKGRPCPGPR